MKQKMQTIGGELKTQAKILGSLVAVFWIITFINEIFLKSQINRLGINILGIFPRELIGLRGILFAPFLHGGFYHVAANTVPFIVLGWLVMLRNISDLGGLGTWLVGSPYSVHIGASGVIFGYFGYLLFRGYFERSFVAIAISLVIAVTYGSLIWGVLPTRSYISWEGHLFGFIGGIIAAKLLSPSKSVP
jgi:membrane associated rhomboid family serine protease